MLESKATTAPRPRALASGLLWALLGIFLAIDFCAALFDQSQLTSRSVTTMLWLAAIAAPLAFVHVRVSSGYLSLSGVVTSVSALTLSPRATLLVSIVAGVLTNALVSRAPLLARAALTSAVAAWTVTAAWLVTTLRSAGLPEPAIEATGIVLWILCNWLMTACVAAAALRTNPFSVLGQNVNRHWIGAFAYIGISAVLITNLIDGTFRGYVLSALAVVLSLALADAVAGRQLNRTLLSQLTDAERYLGYSRIVEGTIHNVRNFIAAAIGTLDEARSASDARLRARYIGVSREAMQDAADTLTALESGASPKVVWSHSPVDLHQLADGVVGLVAERAAHKRVDVSVRCIARPTVYCDAVLIRQVITNLVLNAIDAVPSKGHVLMEIGWRFDDARISVADNGAGVPDKYRDRLFEPHFTTKANGTGLGLFVSYGIAREHRGDLLYEGSHDGAVFTLILKKDARE